ncbi:DUF1007 family protein [Shinella zoogloeoides]
MISKTGVIAFAATFFLAQAFSAEAHPHVFADGNVILDIDDAKELTAVRNEWTFISRCRPSR